MTRRRALACAALAAAAVLISCAGARGPRPIRPGEACATCGMSIQDLRFACERTDAPGVRTYDSIECLLRDPTAAASARTWLTDYDTRALHASDSLWVVEGALPSPMGGGLAAFLSPRAARAVARHARGRVSRLGDVLAGTTGAAP